MQTERLEGKAGPPSPFLLWSGRNCPSGPWVTTRGHALSRVRGAQGRLGTSGGASCTSKSCLQRALDHGLPRLGGARGTREGSGGQGARLVGAACCLILLPRTPREERAGPPFRQKADNSIPHTLQPQVSPQACFSLSEPETAGCLELAEPATAGAPAIPRASRTLSQGSPGRWHGSSWPEKQTLLSVLSTRFPSILLPHFLPSSSFTSSA